MTTDQPTKVSFNACPRAVTAMEVAAANVGLSRTDTLNRAIQLYAAVTRFPFWAAVRVLWRERAALRRAAALAARQARTEDTAEEIS